MSDGFRIATAYVAVEASDEGFKAKLDAKVKEAAEGTAAKIKLEADADGLAEKVRAEAAAADAETHIRIKVDESGGGITSELESLGSEAETEADAIGGRIGSALGNGLFRDANGYIRNASGQFASDEEKIAAGLEGLGDKADKAGGKLGGAGKSAKSAASDAGSSSGAWSALGSAVTGTGTAMKVLGGISLAPALGAIPGLAAGAAAGLGVLIGAALGVAKALKDAGAATGGGGGGPSGSQLAATAYANAVAIRGAQQQIDDAREQGARAAQQSAEQIQNAQLGVVDAERNAAIATRNSADQIVAAQQHVTDAVYAGQQAQQAYTNALYNEQQAEQALVNAKQAAADQLVDSQNAAADAHLATEDAAQNAATAEKALTDAQKAGATPDQLAALDLAARKASQQLTDAKQREKEATEKATAATKAGADQAPTVVAAQHAVDLAAQATASAQHGVAQAAQQQADAQAGLVKAQQAAADQQITSAQAVAKAQQSLADAERQADQQREDSAKTLQRAQQNLTDTIREQQLAAAASASGGSAGVDKFANDMKNLSAAGRDFVNTALGMKGELHDLSLEAQTATLPGFTQMLKDSQHLLPTVKAGIDDTGHALSDMALAFGRLFANKDFDASAAQFEKIITGGFQAFTTALPPLLNAIVVQGDRAAPLINSVALGVHDLIASGLPNFLAGLNVNAGGAAVGVSALFRGVNALLGPVGTLAGAASGALGPALDKLEPGLVTLADDIEGDLLPLMPQLSKDLVDVANVADQVFTVLEPIIPEITDGLGSALRIVDPLLQDTASFLHDNANWLTPVAEGALAVAAAWKTWQTASSIAKSATAAVTGAVGKVSKAASDTASAAEKAAAGVGGFVNRMGYMLPVAGMAVPAIIALGTELNKIIYGSGEAASTVDQFSAALLNSAAHTTNAVSQLNQYAQVSQAIGSNKAGVTDQLAQTGLGMIELSKVTFATTDDLKNYDASLAAMTTDGNSARAAEVVQQLTNATDAHGQKIVDVSRDLPAYSAAVEKAGVEQQSTARSTTYNKDATDSLGQSLDTTRGKFQAMSGVMSQNEALDQFHSSLLNLKDAADQNGTSLDKNTVSGLKNRQTFSDLANQVLDYGQKLHDAGDANGDVGFKMQDMINQLETQGAKFGYSKSQVDSYIKDLGLIPTTVSTSLETDIRVKMDQAALNAALDDIGHTVAHHIIPGNAAGGLITGPGSGTSDSIVRRVSNGEFVMPADTVSRFGVPFMESLRNNQIPAAPAPAAAPVTVNFYGTQYPTPEQQQILIRDLELAVRG